jgi:hypothetical protein
LVFLVEETNALKRQLKPEKTANSKKSSKELLYVERTITIYDLF